MPFPHPRGGCVVLSALSSSPSATVWSPPPRGRCVFFFQKAHLHTKKRFWIYDFTCVLYPYRYPFFETAKHARGARDSRGLRTLARTCTHSNTSVGSALAGHSTLNSTRNNQEPKIHTLSHQSLKCTTALFTCQSSLRRLCRARLGPGSSPRGLGSDLRWGRRALDSGCGGGVRGAWDYCVWRWRGGGVERAG